MVYRDLQWFEPFRHLSRSDLALVAQHTQMLTIPAGRWLVQPGRVLGNHYFLVKGKVRLFDQFDQREHIVSARSRRARHALYPGAAGVASRTTVQVLVVDPRPLRFLKDWGTLDMGSVVQTTGTTTDLADQSWQCRFLDGGVMQRLSSGHWQKALRCVRERHVAEGEWIVRTGELGTTFFIVQEGEAVVMRDGRALATLHPGAYFGEDALITDGHRRADVQMVSEGLLGEMAAVDFRELLLKSTVRFVREARSATVLGVGEHHSDVNVHLPLINLRETVGELDATARYVVVGDRLPDAALGAFILTHRGIDAWVLKPGC